MKRIFKATLRTLGVESAERFYVDVLGTKPAGAVPLHENAIARGAKPHWLGYIEVDEVDSAVPVFLERGATSMGPKTIVGKDSPAHPEGFESAMFRDAGGALIALAKQSPIPSPNVPEIVFQTLDTPDVARAMATYGELFGWHFGAPIDLGKLGVFHPFSWEKGGHEVGVFGDIANRPSVHPHWCFYYRVAALDDAIARVKAGGGVSLGPIELPSGARIAVCDDPQGAAFGLYQAP